MKYICAIVFSLLFFSCGENSNVIEIKGNAEKLIKVDAIFIDKNQDGEISDDEKFGYNDDSIYVYVKHFKSGNTCLGVFTIKRNISFSCLVKNAAFYKVERNDSKQIAYCAFDSFKETPFIIGNINKSKETVLIIYNISIITNFKI